MGAILVAGCESCEYQHIWTDIEDFVRFMERRTGNSWENIRMLTRDKAEEYIRDFVIWVQIMDSHMVIADQLESEEEDSDEEDSDDSTEEESIEDSFDSIDSEDYSEDSDLLEREDIEFSD